MSWNPWRDAREAKKREMELHLAALASLEKVAVAQSEAYKALAAALQDYFDAFKTQGEPRSWVSTDFSEWQKEQNELMEAAGCPPGAAEADKLRWLAQELEP